MFSIFWYRNVFCGTSCFWPRRSHGHQAMFELLQKSGHFVHRLTHIIDRGLCIEKKQCLVVIAGWKRNIHWIVFGSLLIAVSKRCQKKFAEIFFQFCVLDFLGMFYIITSSNRLICITNHRLYGFYQVLKWKYTI